MIRTAVWTTVRILVTVAIIVYVLRDFDARAAAAALRGFSNQSILLLVALVTADRALMLARWILLIRTATDLPLRNLARIFLVSSFVGSFLPAGVGGDAVRAVAVSRETREPGAAVASVLLDRLLGLLAVGISGCLGVLLAREVVTHIIEEITFLASAALLVACVAALYADRLMGWVMPLFGRVGPLRRLALKLSGELGRFRRHPETLWSVAALSVVVQGVRIGIAVAIGRGLGIALPFEYYLVFMPLNILIVLIPVSLGGFGLPQGAMVWSLSPFGVSSTQAVLLSSLFVLAGIFGNMPGAILYIEGRRGGAN